MTTKPAWTFAHRHKSQIDNQVPGPGAYSFPSFKPTGFSQTTAQRSLPTQRKNIPGPGAYCPLPQPDGGFRFSSGSRLPLNLTTDSVPGPGSYSLESNVRKGPRYPFARRYKEWKRDNGPGPGEYTRLFEPGNMRRNWSFGKSQRGVTSRYSELPGPGDYEIRPKMSEKGGAFGKEERHKETKSMSPGPGAYYVERKSDYSMTSRSTLGKSWEGGETSSFLNRSKGLPQSTATRSQVSIAKKADSSEPVLRETVSLPKMGKPHSKDDLTTAKKRSPPFIELPEKVARKKETEDSGKVTSPYFTPGREKGKSKKKQSHAGTLSTKGKDAHQIWTFDKKPIKRLKRKESPAATTGDN